MRRVPNAVVPYGPEGSSRSSSARAFASPYRASAHWSAAAVARCTLPRAVRKLLSRRPTGSSPSLGATVNRGASCPLRYRERWELPAGKLGASRSGTYRGQVQRNASTGCDRVAMTTTSRDLLAREIATQEAKLGQ